MWSGEFRLLRATEITVLGMLNIFNINCLRKLSTKEISGTCYRFTVLEGLRRFPYQQYYRQLWAIKPSRDEAINIKLN